MAAQFPMVPWAKGASLYEVNIRQYTTEGTFRAFAAHLHRLKSMSVDILWLMPITPISKKGRQGTLGSYYACSSYVEVNPEFGNLDDLRYLIDQAHELGMKVIIDWVANHTGQDHEWTKDHQDFHVRDAKGGLTERNGWIDVADLNYKSPDMQVAMISAMKYWIKETKIDGFRCDMAHLVPLEFWLSARAACEEEGPLFWLAECDAMAYHEVFDVTYSWNWMQTIDKYHRKQASLNDVRNVLHAYSQYPDTFLKLYFTSNHDENSWNGTEFEKYDECYKAWAVFCNTWQRGMPLLYSGQENPNKKRLKFFDKDLIEWQKEPKLTTFYKRLFELHKSLAITDGETFILPTNNNFTFFYLRKYQQQVVLVLLNLSNNDRLNCTVEHPWLEGDFAHLYSGLTFTFGKKESFELEKNGYLVYVKGIDIP